MHSPPRAAVVVFAVVLLGVASASARITGGISGFVTDSSSAVISGASVVAIDIQTGVKTSVTTDAKGFRGKKIFASTCAGCHGLDGRGGERAPDIAKSARVQRLSDSEILHIIENGIPGTGMPAFHSFAGSDTKALVTYLRTLQGAKGVVSVPGNSDRGEAIFTGKAGCSGCHMAAGKGGFIASDLSSYARTHTVEEARAAIIHPATNSDRPVRLATATLLGGEKYTGRVRGEDNFSLQLQALDGTFHFISKSDLEGMVYDSKPLMPSDYSSTLSAQDVDDVVSYLISILNTTAPEGPKKKLSKRENEED